MAFFLFGLVENLHSDSHGKKNGKNVQQLHTRRAIFNSTSSVDKKISAFVLQTTAFAFRGPRHYGSVRTRPGMAFRPGCQLLP